MSKLLMFLFIFGGIASIKAYEDEDLLYGTFPDDFIWAAATSSYQIEGGWNADGKGLSIWDIYTSVPGNIADGSDGKVACDSYNKYKDDVQLLKELGVSHYRFSVAWARVIPDGVGAINELGIQYYNDLIDELLANSIEPMVTLYHWDLPQDLQDRGGWLNPDIDMWFEEYANLLYTRYGDRVKIWVTLNEPFVSAFLGYGVATMAPGIYGPGTTAYAAGHNLLRAHAKAYRLYERDFRPTQEGKVGITLNIGWAVPKDDSQASLDAQERQLQFDLGWFANAIFSAEGNYPQVMIDKIAEKSSQQGFLKSRLPEFTPEELVALKGSADFFGLNFYTSAIVEEAFGDVSVVSFDTDKDTRTFVDPTWYSSGSSWLKLTPFGLRDMLVWIKNKYNSPDIYITENGVSDTAGNIDDVMRTYYYKYYINNVLKAIEIDGVSVKGYTAWSLMDNFEWGAGYTEKFGIHSVNFSDPDRPRVPKGSAKYYSRLIADNGFIEGSIPSLIVSLPAWAAPLVKKR